MNQQKGLEEAIEELFNLFKTNLERESEVDWNNAEILENEYIRVIVNDLPFEVDFRHIPKVLITYFTAPNKKDYNRVDLEFVDGKWEPLYYSELKILGGFKEHEVQRVIRDYLFYVKKIVGTNK